MTLSLDPILNSSRFPRLLEQLISYAEEEQRKREAFYDWITEDSRAEFINGEVIVQSPAKMRHTNAATNLTTLLRTFVSTNDLGIVLPETALITLTRNDYLPDISFFGTDKAFMLEPDQMKFPAPDMIVEVLSPSTEKTDRTTKMIDYAEHHVGEYWLVDPASKSVEIYSLENEAFQLVVKQNTGEIGSSVVTGFSIPVEAIFDIKQHNQTLMAILSAE